MNKTVYIVWYYLYLPGKEEDPELNLRAHRVYNVDQGTFSSAKQELVIYNEEIKHIMLTSFLFKLVS